MRRIEKRGVVNVLCDDDGNGCMPATRAEIEFFDEIERLRAEVERAHNAGFVEASRIHGVEITRLRAEVETLKAKAAAFDEWHSKTDWVQTTSVATELGMHRADVMRKRIDALQAAARKAAAWFEEKDNFARGIPPLAELRRALGGDHG